MKIVLLFPVVVLFVLGMFFVFTSSLQVEENIPRLNIQDAFGQMLIIGFEGTEMTPELESLMRDIRPGGVLLLGRNIKSKEQVRKLVDDLQKVSFEYSGLPLFVAVDQEGGLVSRLPFAEHTSQSGLKDYDHALSVGKKRAQDLKGVGVNMNLAPVLDSNNTADFVYPRSFQKNSADSLQLAQGLMQGHQEEGVISVPKHVPGYDGISFNPEDGAIPRVPNFPDVSFARKLLEDSKPRLAMISHVIYQEVDREYPLPLSSKGLQFLKQEIGGHILLMSDDLSSKSLMSQYSFGTIGTKALQGGVDMLLVGGYLDASLVSQFHSKMQQALAQESRDLAGVNKIYQSLRSRVTKEPMLEDLVQKSAEKVIALKKEMLIQ